MPSPLENLLNAVKEVSDVGVLKGLYERAMKEYANDAPAIFAIQETVLAQKERLERAPGQPAQNPAVERLLDDGRFFVEWNINYPREQANGFLMVRCESHGGWSVREPGGFAVAGGYEQKLGGKWVADVFVPYDEEKDSDCLVLGEFDTRNEAIMALWDGRFSAQVRAQGALRVDYAVAEAWDKAVSVTEGKGNIVFGSVSEGREFNGKVLHANSIYVVQNMGRGVAVHAAGALSRPVEVGEVLTVKYDAQGRGVIAERQIGLERE